MVWSKTEGPGDAPLNKKLRFFSDEKMGSFFGCDRSRPMLAILAYHPKGICRILATFGWPHRIHNAVTGIDQFYRGLAQEKENYRGHKYTTRIVPTENHMRYCFCPWVILSAFVEGGNIFLKVRANRGSLRKILCRRK